VKRVPQTDLQILRALLSLPQDKLYLSKKKLFQFWYDDLMNGKMVNLSEKQRTWAEDLFLENNLDRDRPPSKVIEVRDKGPGVIFLDNMPKPLKPPGK
jgi:hypothetical protein